MQIKARVVHKFWHDRFYDVGNVVSLSSSTFADLKDAGLVVEADPIESKPPLREAQKPRAQKR
ncbi:hypothetical protein [Paraburkholderia atlantica]|uniref:hypothetical protein n=1 Tax=Paraburkholderia atlantica TaxID=2654982 RepID=UPI000369896D|nr:hypothetical protein [Paraburkholderia atlantica]